ncbi:unnamed protein product [Bursaphelenchus okinawaensis]|uniref:G_PROTEIN_RECEP_F1_2 domain-containing protein n=1 Tax=Bursaphelenchus okinawaensis TaxID=465554 RepID=A0A811L8M4_9BILA|nr:unnamed protein product [Bursaphelenchus okinawaensis]CAG9118030.1 unnamed protein product [Bursaphelenchus okinawaensis]
MELPLFNPVEFEKLYNCTLYDEGYFDEARKPNTFVGFIYMSTGMIYELLYIPCLITMTKPKFFKTSCYKLMFFIGLIDILTIPFNATLYGYFAWNGYVYCDSPKLMYFSGAFTTALWCAASMTCVLLALNRLCDMMNRDLMELLFADKRTFVWFIFPCLYFCYFFLFTKPFMFTSAFHAGFSNPYVGTKFHAQTENTYMNFSLIVHNICIPILMVLIYTIICIFLLYKTMRHREGERGLSKYQKSAVTQSSMLCSVFVMAPMIYDYMNYFGAPPFMVVIGQICWQGCHGSAVIIYLVFNKTLRDEMFKLFLGGKLKISMSISNGQTNTRTASMVPQSEI